MTTSELIAQHIADYSDWRGERLKTLRRLIHAADPEITEEWKWDVPVFTHDGLVCAISGFKDHVKINFFNGAVLPNPKKLFNSGLDSKKNRSINYAENDTIDEIGVTELIKEAVMRNTQKR